MDISRLRTRRNILALALAGVAARVAPVRAAQTTAGCDIGFTYGLLTIGGEDCKLLSPPGLDGADISLPGHMIDDTGTSSSSSSSTSQGTTTAGSTSTTTSTSTTDPQAERQAKLRERRSKKRRKKQGNRDHREKKRDRRRNRKKERIAALITCEDFKDQKSAIEWLAQHPEDAAALDPNDDGLPCVNLPRVSCSQFTDAKETKQWLLFYGYLKDKNDTDEPFGLYDEVAEEFCPAKG